MLKNHSTFFVHCSRRVNAIKGFIIIIIIVRVVSVLLCCDVVMVFPFSFINMTILVRCASKFGMCYFWPITNDIRYDYSKSSNSPYHNNTLQ